MIYTIFKLTSCNNGKSSLLSEIETGIAINLAMILSFLLILEFIKFPQLKKNSGDIVL
jgi:hypothetical protein